MKMKTSKKIVAFFVTMGIVVTLLVGCGANSKKPTDNSNSQTEGEDSINSGTSEFGGGESEEYPAKQLTITCPPAAGGGTDLLLRAMAPAIQESLGVPVVVVNKPGAGCAIGFSEGAKDPTDGSSVTAAVAEMLSVPYVSDVDFTYKSFESICNVNSCYGTVTVAADAPYDTLEEFIAYCKEHPGEVRFGNSGIGSNWHVLAAAFAQAAGIDVVHVPFDGGGPAAVALAGGHVEAVPVSAQEVEVHVKSGKAKILAVFSPERLPEWPDVPTAAECGFGDIQLTIYRGFVAPKGTPQNIIAMLDQAFQDALADPDVTEFMETQHFSKNYLNAEDFYKLMEREDKVYAEQFEALGLAK